MRTLLLFFVVVLAGCAASPEHVSTEPATDVEQTSTERSAIEEAAAADDGFSNKELLVDTPKVERIVCRREVPTGSHRSVRVCRRIDKKSTQKAQDAVRREQGRAARGMMQTPP